MSGTLTICSIPDDLKERIRKFRFDKSTTMNCLIVKINRSTQAMAVDEDLVDCSLEEIQENLPDQEPRFIILSYSAQREGRLFYPLCLIFYSPSGCNPDSMMLYAGSRNSLISECEITKSFDIREPDELTSEYLDSKACF